MTSKPTRSVTVQGVTKLFPRAGVVGLADVSLHVPAGALLALVGPSGSGKTTLLRIIAGLDYPDTGAIRVGPEDVTNTPARLRGLGVVFQHYALFQHLTVFENIAFPLRVRHRSRAEITARVTELLALMQLDGFAARRVTQLSGGQAQRVALARALAPHPSVLLLDEPFGALDTEVRHELRAWLRALHDDLHVTTILVTHDQDEALDLADHVAVLRDGRLEQLGTPAELTTHPATPFVEQFFRTHRTRSHSIPWPDRTSSAQSPPPSSSPLAFTRNKTPRSPRQSH